MDGVEALLSKPINKVNRAKNNRTAEYHYDEARAAAVSLLALSREYSGITEGALEDAVAALDLMLHDEQWLVGWRDKGKKVKKSLQADIQAIGQKIADMRKKWARRAAKRPR